VRGKFDTVICNPPYLPNDAADEGAPDPALHGGPKGYEYIVRVLGEVHEKLAPDGQFLFLISSLTKPAVVEKELRRLGFAWEIVAREALFMEELFVYRAVHALGERAERIGEGWRSTVYAIKNGRVAVKRSTPERAHKEGVLLRAANKAGVGPKLLRVRDEDVFMERVHGERLDRWFAREQDVRVVRRAFAQCYALDRAGIRKRELNRPGSNVLVTPQRRVVLLDFERSVFVAPGACAGNVTQFAGWASTVLHVNARAEALAYANNPSLRTYRALLRALGV
jgi:predicted Ser/Thr protein kinase